MQLVIKIYFTMSEKKNKILTFVLTLVKYAVTLALGALGGANL